MKPTLYNKHLSTLSTVHYELPDDLEARVPILMLQPVVENGVIHGILPQAEGGRIGVCITREKKALHFKVWDSGVGLFNINNRLKKCSGLGWGWD